MMSWRENSDRVTSSQDSQKSEVNLTPRMASWINCDEFRILQNLRRCQVHFGIKTLMIQDHNMQ